MTVFYIALLLILCVLNEAAAETNYDKCTQVSTYGYKYNSAFKLESDRNAGAEIHFFVRTKSDAHIVLGQSMGFLGISGSGSLIFHSPGARERVVEIVIGGGRNTWSSIRAGTENSKTEKAKVETPGIVSPDNYRAFWIKVSSEGFVSVGHENETEPILAANPFSTSMMPFEPVYFGLSSWNNIKGHWKLNCPNESHTEISDTEVGLPEGLQKLQWDLIGMYDPNIAPEPRAPEDEAVFVHLALQIHHISLDEHAREFTMGGKVYLSWYDGRLKWNPADYNGTVSFKEHSSEVWTPAISVLISKNANQPISSTETDVGGVLIQSNGSVEWTPMFQLKSFIWDMKVDNWPHNHFKFVTHLQCGIIYDFFYSGIETSRIDLEAAKPELWQILEVRSEWKIVNITAEDTSSTDNEDDPSFYKRMLTLAIDVKRDTTSYLEIYLSPFAALAIMSLSSFWLKPHQDVKLYIHCVSLIVISCYIITLVERIPAHVAQVPAIFNVYTTSLILSCVSIINYVCAKNLRYCTWTMPHSWRLLFTHPLVETFLGLPGGEGDSSLESKDWSLINVVVERLIFFIFLFIYICVYASAK